MANKFDIAQYLVNLNVLMDAQAANGTIPSSVLKDEYNRVWGQLKEEINHEARQSQQQHAERSEAGTERARRQ